MFELEFPVDERQNAQELRRLLNRRSEKLRKARRLNPEKDNIKGSKKYRVYEDSEELKRVKNFGGEDTYEIWLQEKEINKNFDKFLDNSTTTKKTSKKRKNDDWEEQEEEQQNEEEKVEDEDEEEDSDVPEAFGGSLGLARARYKIKNKGLEILPYIESEDDSNQDYLLTKRLSYSKRHTLVLNKILHLNILKRNWKIAYRSFSLLIRLRYIDIRSLWPLGVEILTRLAEEHHLSIQPPDKSNNEYNLRTTKLNLAPELFLFRDEQFLTWMQNFYPPYISKNPELLKTPIPYKSSSKNTAPMFVLTLVWNLLMRQEFTKVNDKLSQLLLLPPYITDGTFHFLQGLSHYLEASQLSKEKDMDTQRVETLLLNSKKFFKDARDLNCDFPEQLFSAQMTLIERRISRGFENDIKDKNSANRDRSSTPEDVYSSEEDDGVDNDVSMNDDGDSD